MVAENDQRSLISAWLIKPLATHRKCNYLKTSNWTIMQMVGTMIVSFQAGA